GLRRGHWGPRGPIGPPSHEGHVMGKRSLAALTVLLAALWAARAGDEARKIPLESIYATTGQKGVKKMTTASDGAGKFSEPYGEALKRLQVTLKGGPAVALVTGKDSTA